MSKTSDDQVYLFGSRFKKDGSEIVLMDFDKYLETLSPSDIKSTESHNIVPCPICEYHSNKLYLKKGESVGFCFHCDRTFIDYKDELDLSFDPPTFEPKSLEPFSLVKLDKSSGFWNLDMYFSEFDELDDKSIAYLNSRHKYLPEIGKKLGMKQFNGDIVIPFYLSGELIYYQLRFVNPKTKGMKYFSPPIKKKPPYIPLVRGTKKWVLCEGVFDAIACLVLYPDRTPYATLGSTITPYQLSLLKTFLPDDILLYYDETSISKKVLKKLEYYIPYAQLNIKYSSGEDPEEYLKSMLK